MNGQLCEQMYQDQSKGHRHRQTKDDHRNIHCGGTIGPMIAEAAVMAAA